jgi:hypothetical protein
MNQFGTDAGYQEIMNSMGLRKSLTVFMSVVNKNEKYRNQYQHLFVPSAFDPTKNEIALKQVLQHIQGNDTDEYKTFVQRSLRTTDTYGMGMALLEMLQFCIFFMPTNMYNSYYSVFSKMCNMNVFERIDEIQAMGLLDQLTNKNW